MANIYFSRFVSVFAAITLVLNFYIYTYPSFNPSNCSWNDGAKHDSIVEDLLNHYIFKNQKTPKQLDPNKEIRLMAIGDPQINGNWEKTPYIKRLDNFGNDYYLGHIYKVMKERLLPTHVSVMGDLFSSQWIGDSEFFNRTRRYLTRLYPQPEANTKEIFEVVNKHETLDWKNYVDHVKGQSLDEAFDYHFENTFNWVNNSLKSYDDEPLFINLTGNHDIGYSGDATWQHINRFRLLFGKDNFYIEYFKNTPQAYRIVILNSLTLEGPALQEEFIQQTEDFLNKLKSRNFNGQTILLTHIPFYKKKGLCYDGPKHDYYNEETSKREPYKLGKLRSQNHLSYEITQKVLNIVFGNSTKPGIILTGHDHYGCYNVYDQDPVDSKWEANDIKKHDSNKKKNYIQEIVVRSVMGDFDGNIGLMTGNFVNDQWVYEYTNCPFIVQHVWWVTKVMTILLFGLTGLQFIL